MKKSLLALAVLGAFAGAASAQSSVTLFGVVDQSVNYQKSNGLRVISLDSNQLSSNRIGFKGFEDLGGGLQAGFHLEAGMTNDIGTAGGSNSLPGATATTAFFNRRSTVSLLGKFGEIRLGRDYTPTFWNIVLYDVYGANGIGEGLNLVNLGMGSGYGATARANNSVAYWLPPNAGGFYGRFQVAAGEGVVGQKYYGGSLNWAGAGLDVGAGYGDTKGTPGTAPDLKIYNFGASYDFGVAKIYGLYTVQKWDPREEKVAELSVGVPVGAGAINASYTYAKYSGSTALVGKADQYSLQYIYNLSKRTALYGTVAHISNKSGAAFGFGDVAVTANHGVNGANVGLKHSF